MDNVAVVALGGLFCSLGKILYMLLVAVARSFSDDSRIHYSTPIHFITFHMPHHVNLVPPNPSYF